MFPYLVLWLSLHASVAFFQWCFHGPARYMERTTACYVLERYLLHWYQKLMELPLKWHKDHHSGEIVSRIDKSSESLNRFIQGGFQYIETISRLLIGTIAIFAINWVIGVGVFSIGVLIIGIILLYDKYLIPKAHQLNDDKHKVKALLFDYLTNAVSVLILRLQGRTQKTIKQRYQPLYTSIKEHTIIQEFKWFTVSMIVMCITFGSLLYYCWSTLARGETILVGSLVILYQYLERFIEQFFQFTWQYGEIVQYNVDVESLNPIAKDHKRLVKKEDNLPQHTKWKSIQIQQLQFSHESQEDHLHTLKHISLHLERGKRYAFVGESGSGKSTLLTLLRGIEDMDEGTVFIDDTPFQTTRILSPISTLCPQDPEIFENTIEYNITVDTTHSKKILDRCLDGARFRPVVERLPKGLHTNIKEKGVNLSGGEKQRLALARGLYAAQQSSLLLLDEPTSSVDPKNEQAIYQNIFEMFPTTTIVSALHRLHLLPLFDYFYIFDQGELVQEASFLQLKKEKGHYQTLWKQYQARQES